MKFVYKLFICVIVCLIFVFCVRMYGSMNQLNCRPLQVLEISACDKYAVCSVKTPEGVGLAAYPVGGEVSNVCLRN